MTQNIEIIDSWNLSSPGIIAELKHHFNGLQSGLIVKSQSTNNTWKIEKRILYSHTNGKQKIFANEKTSHSILSFNSIDMQITSAEIILEKESHSIFQYQLQAIGHTSKPIKGTFVKTVFQKFPCPCCGYKTFGSNPGGSYVICPVCLWEDDPIQLCNPDYVGGANRVSLRQGQKNFRKFGACEEQMINNVQKPNKDEARDENWTWLE